ncbi:MAG TPA: polysaccharide biosynthesis C-terminal domain-containing protein [Vicinamibacterales bacterium]|nr:polysaccharide biosynthesis C-terminal domain-containing protein [Vicinamibacterales bacterium]
MRRVLLIVYRALSDMAGKAAVFAITVVAARRLSQDAFGIFSLASVIGWLLALTTDFGIPLHLARAVARRPDEASGILSLWVKVRLWTAAIAIALVAVTVPFWPATSGYTVPILLFALVYIISALIDFLHYFYRGIGRSDVESTLTLWSRAITLGAALLALAWSPDLTILALAMLAPVLATFVWSLWLASRLARESAGLSHGALAPAPAPFTMAALWPEFRRDVFPIGAGIVLSALYFRIDLLLVETWHGTEPVALYNAAFRLVETVRLFPAAVLAVTLPSLCRATDTRPLRRVAGAVSIFAVVVTPMLWAAAGWGLPIVYGTSYAAAVPAFRILILALPLMSLNFALTHQLIGWDGQRAYAVICAVALAVNLALNVFMIPALSIEGAAWATVWTEIVVTAGCAMAIWRAVPRPAHASLSLAS